MQFGLGAKQSPPDKRDYISTAAIPCDVDTERKFSWRNKVPFVRNQLNWGTCHDKETEVLTKHGWKLFCDLSKEDQVASVNIETNELVYVKPRDHITYRYTGDMIHFNHSSLDCLVTPDHKMVVRKWDESQRSLSPKYAFVDAKDIGWYSGLMNYVEWHGDSIEIYKLSVSERIIPMDWWLRFLGLYIAEGTLMPGADYRIQIAAYKDREKSYANECFSALGIHASEYEDRFFIHSKELCIELMNLGYEGIHASEKFVPEFVFNLSSNLISCLLEGFIAGDGYIDNNSIRSMYTTSTRLCGQLQHLTLLAGKWSSVYTRDPRNSEINGRTIIGKHQEHRIHEWKSRRLSIRKSKDVKIVPYDDMVYCLTVEPYHTLVTRRNGKMLISGNCVGFGSMAVKNIQEAVQCDLPDGGVSPLYVYTLCKSLDGIPNEQGTYPRIAMQVMNSSGALPEKDLPYSLLIDHNNLPKITQEQITKALPYKIKSYVRIPHDKIALKQAIKQGPILAASLVTDTFMKPEGSGFIRKPEGTIYGGHCYAIIGHDDDMEYKFINGEYYKGFVEIENSWGPEWGGDSGFAWIPYDLLNYKTDLFPFMYEMWTSVDDGVTPEKPKYWRVQCGAFSIKDNAHKCAEQLKLSGFPTYIISINGLYKVQLGAYSVETNARNMLQRVKDVGYADAFVIYY